MYISDGARITYERKWQSEKRDTTVVDALNGECDGFTWKGTLSGDGATENAKWSEVPD